MGPHICIVQNSQLRILFQIIIITTYINITIMAPGIRVRQLVETYSQQLGDGLQSVPILSRTTSLATQPTSMFSAMQDSAKSDG